MVMSQDKLFEEIATTLAGVVGIDSAEVTPDKTLAALDVDSLALAEVIVSLEDRLGLLIPDDDWSRFSTIGALASYLEGHSVGV